MAFGYLTQQAREKRWAVLAVGLLAFAVLVVGAWLAWGPVGDRRDANSAKDVLVPFLQAIRERDYEAACSYFASTAPLRAAGDDACIDRLPKARQFSDLAVEFESTFDTDVKDRRDGRLIVAAFEPGAVVLGDSGPSFLFAFVRENGDLRIERFLGYSY